MQNLNLIPPFFLEILQRYYKLAILGTLCMPAYHHQKRIILEKLYLPTKNQIYPSPLY